MSKFLSTWLLILIFSQSVAANTATVTSQQKRELQFTTNGNVVLIDAYEKDCRIVTNYLKILVESQSAALIISSSLWPNLLKCKPKNYDPSEWINRKTDDGFFYVLVPRNYLNNLLPVTQKGDWTANEIRTGLKIDHLTKIDDQDMLDPSQHIKMVPEDNKSTTSDSFVKKISDLFLKHFSSTICITNQEYFAAKASDLIPKSAFVFIGHGKYKKFIVYLTPKTLQKVLGFLDDRLTVPFVLLTSCYSGSLNMKAVLKEDIQQNELLAPHNFFLFSSAIAAAPIETANPYYNYQYDFSNFFNELRGRPPLDFVSINRKINAFYDETDSRFGYETFSKNNYLMVKPPGLPWMYHADLPEKIVSFGKALQGRTKPLDVSTFFAGRQLYGDQKELDFDLSVQKKIYPDMILFYTRYIPFKLILSAEKKDTQPPSFISMLPGDRVTKIAAIDASQFTFSQMVNAFFPIRELADTKIFVIDKLTVTNDVTTKLAEQPLELENVIVIHQAKTGTQKASQEIFFNHNKKSWEANVTTQSLESALQQDDNQRAALNKVKKTIEKTKNSSDFLFRQTHKESEKILENLKKTVEKQALTIKKSEQLQKNIDNLARGLVDIVQSQGRN